VEGWISVHRKLLGSVVFNNPDLLKVWMWCLLKASHKKHKQLVGYQEQTLFPGELIFGRKKTASDLGYSESKTYRLIKRLEELGNITIKSNNKYSVITVVNWELYQGIEQQNEQQNEQEMNNKRTTNEQQMNTNNNDNNDNNLLFMYDENLKEIVKLLQENIGVIPPILIDLVGEYADTFDSKMFAEAIIIATNKKVRSVKYVLGILKQWKDSNILTLEDLDAFRREKELEKEKKPNNNQNGSKYNSYSKKAAPKKTRFHNFESRTDKYDNKELEKMADKKRKAKKPDSSSGLAFLDQFKETEE